ncbi:MAG: adenylate/guanylate cyclase domain-containing protein, partial [Solirubrobacteraceae bacterium]
MTLQCPSCATEVPDGMQFCGACGAELPARCRACGTVAAAASQRFCGACGTPFQQPTAPPRERRLVSVLFCDLVGFTSFSESRDPEDVRDILEHYFRAARRVVVSYGGTIEKFIGDAVMAVWGTPVTLEDDAERCVRAALDLTAAVSDLAERLAIPEFALRAGILTGEAAVDRNAVHTGMVIGDAVNTASRIQSLAKPGTVLVDDVTRQATERAISYETAGIHAVKGKSAGIRVWRPTQVVSRRGGTGAVEPPLVGRNAELGLITDAVDELLASDPGNGIVTVIGGAGLGKTRLALEAERYSDALADRVRWLYGRALAFGEGAGVSALAEVMRMAAGIRLEEPSAHQQETVDRWVGDLFQAFPDEQPRAAAAVRRLLALDDGEELIEQGELFSAWRLVLERLAARRPLVLALEELHQADQGLLDFIAHLLEWAPQAPVRVLAFGRPDSGLESLVPLGRSVTLAPLTDPQMEALVLGAVGDAPPELVEAVCADGGGVPLYAVETLRSLLDSGVLAAEDGHYVVRGTLGELAIPPTLRALVASRLDRLGQLERRVLTCGAVLGERFPAVGAAQLAGVEEGDARTLLDALVAKQLLSLEMAPQSPSRGQYAFLQGLVRRVLLNTLSRRVRRGLHLTAVDYLSQGAPEPELASVLAGHLLTAAELDPTARDAAAIRTRAGVTLREAAERAAAVGASEQALSFFD